MQPPTVAFVSYEQLSIPLTEAEREEERETTMYIEMFSVAKSRLSQVQVESTQVEKPALLEMGHNNNGSERTLSNMIRLDEEGEDKEVQQQSI